MMSKSLNPYDTSAPTELFGDPVVRVFDARMPTRPGPPLQFSMLGAPRLVRFLADESLALASSSGQFLVSKEPFTGEFFFSNTKKWHEWRHLKRVLLRCLLYRSVCV